MSGGNIICLKSSRKHDLYLYTSVTDKGTLIICYFLLLPEALSTAGRQLPTNQVETLSNNSAFLL